MQHEQFTIPQYEGNEAFDEAIRQGRVIPFQRAGNRVWGTNLSGWQVHTG